MLVVTGSHAMKDLNSFGAFITFLKDQYRDREEIPRTVITLLHMYHPQDGYEAYMKVCLFLVFFTYFMRKTGLWYIVYI
jgi:hypothetical protein